MRLLIIGAGPGGYETAIEAVRRGMEVTLITEGPLGGTCLNEGCIPTKTLCHYAGIEEQRRKAGAGTISDFREVINRKNEVVSQLRGGVETLMRGVTIVSGKASFKDSHTVIAGGQEYSADRIIIATGSKSALLPVPGAEGTLTSRELLDLTEIPSSLCIIGGGVIGLEFASIFNSFGTQVTVLEYCKEILPRFDADLAKRLRLALGKRGIRIETQAQVTAVEGSTVRYIKKETECPVTADKVLMAVGRVPAVDGLNLEAAGIEYGRRGIAVDAYCRTSVPGIYAVGDVTGGMMLAHVASYQGLRALNDMVGKSDRIRFDVVPAAVFTVPEVATVGMTEEECRDKGIEFRALKSFYRANGKAVSMDQSDGYCKILASAADNRILGCHILGVCSSDLIHEAAVLMNMNATVDDLHDMIHAHPSLSEILQSAVH